MSKSAVWNMVFAFAMGACTAWAVRSYLTIGVMKEQAAVMLQHDAQWREDCVAAGCAAWVTLEDGKVEWQWRERDVTP